MCTGHREAALLLAPLLFLRAAHRVQELVIQVQDVCLCEEDGEEEERQQEE